MSEFEIRQFDADRDVEVVADLYRKVWGEDGGDDWVEDVRWSFVRSPRAIPVLLAVAANGDVVGVRGGMGWPLVENSNQHHRSVSAVQLHGTAVAPSWRRRGLFSALTLQYVELLRDAGVEIIFNVSVPESMAGYQKIGWKYGRGLVTLMRPVKPLRRMSRVEALPLSKREWVPRAGVSHRRRAEHSLSVSYDRAFAEWRLSRADRSYGVCATDDGVPYRVFERSNRRIIEFGTLAGEASLSALKTAAIAEGAEIMMYRATLPVPARSSLRLGFVPLRRLRLGHRVLGDRWDEADPTLELEGIDIDTF